jgi:hypothetical protein
MACGSLVMCGLSLLAAIRRVVRVKRRRDS